MSPSPSQPPFARRCRARRAGDHRLRGRALARRGRRRDHPRACHGRRGHRRHPDRRRRRRLLLGRAGRVPAYRGRRQRRVRLCRRQQVHRRLSPWSRPARPGTPSPSRSNTTRRRSATASCLQIFFSVAHDPDPAEPPGPGLRDAISLGDLHHHRRAEEGRGRLYRPAQRRQGLQRSRSSPRSGRCRGSIRPRPIIRTT